MRAKSPAITTSNVNILNHSSELLQSSVKFHLVLTDSSLLCFIPVCSALISLCLFLFSQREPQNKNRDSHNELK